MKRISARVMATVIAAIGMTAALTGCKTDEEPDWGIETPGKDDSGEQQPDAATTTAFYESFNALSGHGGNDGYFDNDADANIEIAIDDLTAADNLDNKSGWGDFQKVGICDKCVRIATKKNDGSITTPQIALNGKRATLTFNAAAQLGDDVTLIVSASSGRLTYAGESAPSISIHLPATESGKTVLASQTYTMEIDGAASGCQLTFATQSSAASKQRAFLDEIKVETK